MTRFLLIPRRDHDISLGKPFAMGMDEENRKKNLEDLNSWSNTDKVAEPLMKGIESAEREIGIDHEQLVFESTLMPSYRTIMAESDAMQALQSVFQHMHVIKDREAEFYFPKSAPEPKLNQNLSQTWHLEMTDILALRDSPAPLNGMGVTIAVLDTGIEPIPSLQNQIQSHYIYKSKKGPNGEEIGEIVRRDSQQNHSNEYWHGTAVAELIAGSTVGVAPKARLVDIAMIPEDRGSLHQFISGLRLAASLPEVSLINFSAGLDLKPYEDASINDVLRTIIDSGVLPIAAIGNSGKDSASSPARLRACLSVGAVDPNLTIWIGSGGGKFLDAAGLNTKPEMVAPGADIYTIIRSGEYVTHSGTSYAAPIVTGIASLLRQQAPALSASELHNMLLFACSSLGQDRTREGAGLIKFPISPDTFVS